jgi:carbon-monoxide dehydrogenase small subunit
MSETILKTAASPATLPITVTVNGEPRSAEVEPRLLLVHFLLDGVPVKSCAVLAVQARGRAVDTVEGLIHGGELHPIQQAFHEEHGLQCGYCTPGMMLTSVALLHENADPSEEEIRWALSGNICRCTGYQNIVKAVQSAAATLRERR